MKNKVQLITYADRFGGGDLNTLSQILNNALGGVFGGVHILPFYHPIDGSDAGFDPIDHTRVDERLGCWRDVATIADKADVMADLIVNHVSAQSEQFKDVLANGEQSDYWGMFLKEKDVFPSGITAQQQQAIYRPRPDTCFTPKLLASNEEVNFWTTFTDNQIDINVHSEQGQQYLQQILTLFEQYGVKVIRLDAAGYAIKRAGTSCFMLDETFEFINSLSDAAKQKGMTTVAEIHSHYQTQIDIAQRVDCVYDFALPPLVLHTLFNRDVIPLLNWLKIAPRNCLTVLDTHDGIGIIDAGPQGEKPGLLDPEQIDALVEKMHSNCQDQSRQATGKAASNVDLYQVNSTYYSALGCKDFDYLCARAIQFFAPGVPQVYYGGLLALENDMELLAQTKVGRDINRPYLQMSDIEQALQKPVVKALLRLIDLRNNHNAFAGEFEASGEADCLCFKWVNADHELTLNLDLGAQECVIRDGGDTLLDIKALLTQLHKGSAA